MFRLFLHFLFLGNSYVQDFCFCSANAIGSPFVLLEIINEAATSFSHSTPFGANSTGSLQPYIRSQILTSLINKCQQLYVSLMKYLLRILINFCHFLVRFSACIFFQIQHITSGDYEEFLNTIRSARVTFQMTNSLDQLNGMLQSFNKNSKMIKKDLWTHIMAVMQSPN